MNDTTTVKRANKKWSKTTDGLRKYLPTGIWHLNVWLNGRVVQVSTKLTDHRQAKKFLNAYLSELQASTLASAEKDRGLRFCGALVELFKERVSHRETAGRLLPRSAETLRNTAGTFVARWNSLGSGFKKFEELEAKHLNDLDLLLRWQTAVINTISASTFNKELSVLRQVIDLGIEKGVIFGRSEADRLERKRSDQKNKEIVSDVDFDRILESVKAQKKATSHESWKFLTALNYSGMRFNECRQLRADMIDIEGGWIHLPKEIVKGQKTARKIPIFAETVDFWKQVLREAPSPDQLFAIGWPKDALKNACARLGLPHMSPHSIRHLYASRMMDATGGNARTVALWMGHVDGGKLLMQTYDHVREEESRRVAESISPFKKADNIEAFPAAAPARGAATA